MLTKRKTWTEMLLFQCTHAHKYRSWKLCPHLSLIFLSNLGLSGTKVQSQVPWKLIPSLLINNMESVWVCLWLSYACGYTSVCRHAHSCLCAWKPEINISCWHRISDWTWILLSVLYWLVSGCSPVLEMCTTASEFYMGSGDLNSSPHVCVVSILPIGHLPSHRSAVLNTSFYQLGFRLCKNKV